LFAFEYQESHPFRTAACCSSLI